MENLNEALALLINTALEGVDASVGFLQAELPDIVQQLLTWHFVESLIYFTVGTVLLSILLVIDIMVGRWVVKEEDDEVLFMYLIPGCIGRLILYIVPLAFLNITWLQIWVAPKVWLLEYAAKLL